MIQRLFNQESKSVAGAALIIGASAILSRFLGLIRDRLLVSRFTVGWELDAYYASFQLPNLLFAFLVLGTLSVAFIPVFTEYLTKGRREAAWKMTNVILSYVLLGMGGACLLLIILAPQLVALIAPGYAGEKLELTVRLTRVMMLTPLLFTVSAVFSSVLNSFKRFMSVSLAPLLYNGALIFGIAVLSKPFGVFGVAYGAILGALLHLLVQVPAVVHAGWRWKWGLDPKDPGVREVGGLFLPRVFGIDISQLAQFIGTSIGTTFGTGAPALFNLAMNISAVPVGAIAIPFAIAAFPDLSEASAKGDRKEFVRIFAATFRQVLFFLVPLSALGVILRGHVVRVLIGSSSLTWNEARVVSTAVGLFVLTLAFQGLVPLLARAFYALKNTIVPVLVSAAAVAFNVAAAYALSGWLGTVHGKASGWLMFGLFGIDEMRVLALPIAFSLASMLQVALLFGLLRRRFGRIGGTGIFRAFGKFFAGAAAAVFAANATLARLPAFDDHTTLGQALIQAGLATAFGLAAYVLVLKLLRSEELDSVSGAVRARLFKVKPEMPVGDASGM